MCTNEITHLWDLPPVRSPTNIAQRTLWKSFILLPLFGQTCFLKKLDFVIKKCEKGFSKKGVFHQEDFPPMGFSTKGFFHQWGLPPILLREVLKKSYFVTTFQSNRFLKKSYFVTTFWSNRFFKKFRFCYERKGFQKGSFFTKEVFHQRDFSPRSFPPMISPTNEITHQWDLPPILLREVCEKVLFCYHFLVKHVLKKVRFCYWKMWERIFKKGSFPTKSIFHQGVFPPILLQEV